MKTFIVCCIGILVAVAGFAQTNIPATVESDFIIRDFTFKSKESLPQLRIHYTTLGKPVRDNNGQVVNAVMILHGTTGSGHQFLSERFAGNLFGKGQLLDTSNYYIILPDGIGHGKSSRPSDGLHMKFPHYTYDDMVTAQYRLLTEHLGVNHLRLLMGTSMGGMHTWVWAYSYPDFMDALMPLACLPVEIAGRNRIWRKMSMDLIKADPAWKEGEYQAEPTAGLTGAISLLLFTGSSPLQWQKNAPTREAADSMLHVMVARELEKHDANDMIYQLDASREYNPSPYLEKIKAPLLAINTADDQINPPELNIIEKEITKVKQGRLILIPISDQTTGHGSHSNPEVWGNYLKELLESTGK